VTRTNNRVGGISLQNERDGNKAVVTKDIENEEGVELGSELGETF